MGLKKLLVTVLYVRVASEKHEYSALDSLVESVHESAEVLVTLVEVFVVEVKLELVAFEVVAHNSSKNLGIPYEMFIHQLHSKLSVQVVLQDFHRTQSPTRQNN